MATDRRCPSCGALVAEDAEWCGQCFTSLVEVKPAGPSPSEGPHAPPVALEGPDASHGAFWPCPVCEHRNPIELNVCEVCGTPFARLFREPERRPEVEPPTALLWSALFPGLGHWRCGRTLDGVARAVIFVWTFGTLLIIVVSRLGKGGLGATAALFGLFLVSALAVWASSAYDAYRIAGGYEPLVSSRSLLWGSVVLVVVSVLLATLVTLPAVRGG